MIKFVAGPKASGVGLIRHILRQNSIKVGDLPVDDPGDTDRVLLGAPYAQWMIKRKKESVVVVRCPLASFVTFIDGKMSSLGRGMDDEEMMFHATVAVNQMVFVNSLISSGVKFCPIVPGEGLHGSISSLVKMISPGAVTHRSDVDMFARSCVPKSFHRSMIPGKVMREISRMGTMYDKLGMEVEL